MTLSKDLWERSVEPVECLSAISPEKLTERKRRLLAVHCYLSDDLFLQECRHNPDLLTRAIRAGQNAEDGYPVHNYDSLDQSALTSGLGFLRARPSDALAMSLAITHCGNRKAQADLVREMWVWPGLAGPVLDPTWMTPAVVALSHAAVAVWDPQVGPLSGITTRYIGILADALQDAGCEDALILDHLRLRTWHLRGCWVLDLLNAKE